MFMPFNFHPLYGILKWINPNSTAEEKRLGKIIVLTWVLGFFAIIFIYLYL